MWLWRGNGDRDWRRHIRKEKGDAWQCLIPRAPIRVMQKREGGVCVCVCVCVCVRGEIRWKRGHSLLPEIFTAWMPWPKNGWRRRTRREKKTKKHPPDSRPADLTKWKVCVCPFPMSESSRARIHPHLSRGDNKKPHLPFPHPPDHYHNSVLISAASATQQQRSKNDPKLWLCLLLLSEREMWRFGDGVGAEISQGLWTHSWYKREAFDVAMELCSNEARYTVICPCQTRGGITERQPAC